MEHVRHDGASVGASCAALALGEPRHASGHSLLSRARASSGCGGWFPFLGEHVGTRCLSPHFLNTQLGVHSFQGNSLPLTVRTSHRTPDAGLH